MYAQKMGASSAPGMLSPARDGAAMVGAADEEAVGGKSGFEDVAGRNAGGGRGPARVGRRARGGDWRHRRYLSAQDGPAGAAVRPGAGFPAGLSRARERADIGEAHRADP